MVTDSSALIAILQDEPENARFSLLIEEADSVLISHPTWIETSMITFSRFGNEGLRRLERLRVLVPGNGRQLHLAMAADEPSLFKGDDFIHTDVRIAGPTLQR